MSGEGEGKSVIILGAGMVCRPIVHYLSEKGYKVYLGSRTLSKAEAICKGADNATALALDIETKEGEALLDEYAQKCDAILSLLPYLFHPKAAKYALTHNKHFLTTSYVSEDMKALGPEAEKKGLVFINECGVDPGTDHMSAMKVIDGVRAKGGKITSFTSYCGGLPHPEDNNKPLGYKFSWAPRGVLLASKNTAHFLKDGKDTTIPGEVLFDNFEVVDIPGLGKFESYPNRNSKNYIDIYNIVNTKTIIRGTFRNTGWCKQVKNLVECGYLSLDEKDLTNVTFRELLAGLIKSEATSEADVKAAVVAHLKVEADNEVLKTMEWLGLFSDTKIGSKATTALDALCEVMMTNMAYEEGERDMLLMRHTFTAEYPDGKVEKLTSTMVDYGIKGGDSSMSRTVSLPLAMVTNMVLTGKYTKPGLSIPCIPELYEPLLAELAANGIKWTEEVVA